MSLSCSVITPSFNQGVYIERTIQSVLEQQIANLEYIVVDGASTDATLEVLRKYEGKIKWISEKDKGQTDAVNKGISSTTGEIIGWLNSDDIYYPNALKTVLEFFESNPEIDIIYGDANHINKNDEVIEPYYTEVWNIERLKEVCYLCQPAVFFRRSVIERFGKLETNLKYCMDYEYWFRLALNGANFEKINSVLAGSRLYDETKTLGARIGVHSEINDMLKKKLNTVPNRWLCNYAHVVVDDKTAFKRGTKSYFLALVLVTTFSALRWNRTPNQELRQLLCIWINQVISK